MILEGLQNFGLGGGGWFDTLPLSTPLIKNMFSDQQEGEHQACS